MQTDSTAAPSAANVVARLGDGFDPPNTRDAVNELIDRALLRGAVFCVRGWPTGTTLYAFDDLNEGSARLAALALEAATMTAWPLCRRLIIERALAAGGCLSAYRGSTVPIPEISDIGGVRP